MNINTIIPFSHALYKRIAATDEQASGQVPAPLSQVTNSTPQEEGKNQQTKNKAIKKEEDKQTVSDLIKKSNRRIISISSLFPWTFFANTVEVEESRVTFIFRQFLATQSHSVDIKDISNVFIQSSPFFAKLQIVSRTFVQNDIMIGHLNAKKALRVKMVIEGLRTLAAHDIDTSNYEIKDLIAKIEEFHTNKTI